MRAAQDCDLTCIDSSDNNRTRISTVPSSHALSLPGVGKLQMYKIKK